MNKIQWRPISSSQHRYLRFVGSWLAMLLITLALLELVLRLFGALPVQRNPLSGFFVTHPQLGWVGEPGYRGEFRHADFDVIVEHDALGLRVPGSSARRFEPGATRIAFLGDSFTWGWGVDSAKRFTDVLQDGLGSGSEIRNFGLNAYGTAQELLMLENLVAPFKPDIVVVMFFANDLEDNHNEKEGRRPWFELVDGQLQPRNQPVTGEVSGWWRRVNRYSVALSTLRHAWHMLQERLVAAGEDESGAKAAGPTAAEWDLYRALLARMGDWCAAQTPQCQLRVAVVPSREDVRSVADGGSVPVTERVLQICAELGLPALDLAPGLFAAWEQTPQRQANLTPQYFPHDGHWDEAGHATVAAILRDSWTWIRPARGGDFSDRPDNSR